MPQRHKNNMCRKGAILLLPTCQISPKGDTLLLPQRTKKERKKEQKRTPDFEQSLTALKGHHTSVLMGCFTLASYIETLLRQSNIFTAFERYLLCAIKGYYTHCPKGTKIIMCHNSDILITLHGYQVALIKELHTLTAPMEQHIALKVYQVDTLPAPKEWNSVLNFCSKMSWIFRICMSKRIVLAVIFPAFWDTFSEKAG